MAKITSLIVRRFSASRNPSDSSAREWAEQELAKSKYHGEPSLWERIWEWVNEHFKIFIDGSSSRSTATFLTILLATIVVGIIILLLVKYLRARFKRAKKAQRTGIAPLFDDTRSAEQLFLAAKQARSEGDIKTLIVENFRGAIRLLDEHHVIIVHPGLTATEAARRGSDTLGQPQLFSSAASAFNRVYFSTISPTMSDVESVDKLVTFVRNALAHHNTLVKNSNEERRQ